MWRCSSALGRGIEISYGCVPTISCDDASSTRAMTPRRLVRRRLVDSYDDGSSPLRHRHPHQIVRHGQLPLEPGGPGLPLEFSPGLRPGGAPRFGIPLAEMREHEMPYARVPRHPARLTGRQVTVVDGELVIAVQERRLDDEEVAALGQG